MEETFRSCEHYKLLTLAELENLLAALLLGVAKNLKILRNRISFLYTMEVVS